MFHRVFFLIGIERNGGLYKNYRQVVEENAHD